MIINERLTWFEFYHELCFLFSSISFIFFLYFVFFFDFFFFLKIYAIVFRFWDFVIFFRQPSVILRNLCSHTLGLLKGESFAIFIRYKDTAILSFIRSRKPLNHFFVFFLETSWGSSGAPLRHLRRQTPQNLGWTIVTHITNIMSFLNLFKN